MSLRSTVKVVNLVNLGRFPYRPAWALQKWFEKQHLQHENADQILILVEHDPVYTLGLRQIISPQEVERLKSIGADVVHADRGGLTTYHGPGQLVAYPILNLVKFGGLSLRKYVSNLEHTAIHACRMMGVPAELDTTNVSHTGAWTNNNKICAIGVHHKQFITTHGLALNCDVDLKWYNHIVPCGIRNKGVTSISKELGEKVTVKDVVPQFLSSFDATFKCQLVDFDETELNNIVKQLPKDPKSESNSIDEKENFSSKI